MLCSFHWLYYIFLSCYWLFSIFFSILLLFTTVYHCVCVTLLKKEINKINVVEFVIFLHVWILFFFPFCLSIVLNIFKICFNSIEYCSFLWVYCKFLIMFLVVLYIFLHFIIFHLSIVLFSNYMSCLFKTFFFNYWWFCCFSWFAFIFGLLFSFFYINSF